MDYGQIAELISSGGAVGVTLFLYITDIKAMKKRLQEMDSKLDIIKEKVTQNANGVTTKDLLPLIKKND